MVLYKKNRIKILQTDRKFHWDLDIESFLQKRNPQKQSIKSNIYNNVYKMDNLYRIEME